ncbi:hypothetical protein [Candidatus Villigracilis affinis]|uniref:hypothetical protein n=1 Tax=Candidatus Villigracilis affinis TaxID=3140682 RepID=UPI002A20393F|nr:hypothetical protein [Anaerolineales bacterium]
MHEYVSIVNRGTVPQPMSGWVLASLRGHAFYPFTGDLMLEPGMIVKVQSGQLESKQHKKSGARGKIIVDDWSGLEQPWRYSNFV